MKQQDPEKLARSREILKELKEARGGALLDSHRAMGSITATIFLRLSNDPFLWQNTSTVLG